MKDKYFEIEIKIPIYNVCVHLIIEPDLYNVYKNIMQNCKEHKRLCSKREVSKLYGTTINSFLNEGVVYILIKSEKDDKISLCTLTHEIFHATNRIMELNGYSKKRSDEEAFAMLNGFLNSMIIERLLSLNKFFLYEKSKEIIFK